MLVNRNIWASAAEQFQMIRNILFILISCLIANIAQAQQLPPCTTGQTTCTNDTTNSEGIVAAITDTVTGTRVFNLWNEQCESVYAEAASTTGHILPGNTGRVPMCLAIAAGHIPNPTLLSIIMNPTLQSEILGCKIQGQAAGCLVDADVNFGIAAALAVTETAATTTATQATVGANTLTVADAAGIVRGQSVFAAGVPPGTTVHYISGTTIYLSAVTTAALSSTPVAFVLDTGLPTRAW